MRMVNRTLYWMTAFAAVLVTFWLGYTRKPVAAPKAGMMKFRITVKSSRTMVMVCSQCQKRS